MKAVDVLTKKSFLCVALAHRRTRLLDPVCNRLLKLCASMPSQVIEVFQSRDSTSLDWTMRRQQPCDYDVIINHTSKTSASIRKCKTNCVSVNSHYANQGTCKSHLIIYKNEQQRAQWTPIKEEHVTGSVLNNHHLLIQDLRISGGHVS